MMPARALTTLARVTDARVIREFNARFEQLKAWLPVGASRSAALDHGHGSDLKDHARLLS